MVRSKLRKRSTVQPLMMKGIPVNRGYVYETPFFKEGMSVVEGILFPLKKKRYKRRKVKLGKGAQKFGVSRRGVDVRNISYAGGEQ